MSLNNKEPTTLWATVTHGHRRTLRQLALREGILALTITLLGVAMLLVFGTDVFAPELLLLFLLAGLALAVYRWVRVRPTPYKVAQRLDIRWQAEDQISTAYFFSNNPSKATSLAEQQHQRAARIASLSEVKTALPFQTPGTAFALATMIFVIVVLFGLRFETKLSLQPPLVPPFMAALWDEDQNVEAPDPEPPSEHAQAGEEPAESFGKQIPAEPDTARDVRETVPDASAQRADEPGEVEADLLMPEVEGLSLDEDYGDELATARRPSSSEANSPDSLALSSETEDREKDNVNQGSASMAEEPNDLLGRLKDAFESLLSKLDLKRSSQGQGDQKASGREAAQPSEQGADSSQAGNGEGERSAESAGDAQAALSGSSGSLSEQAQSQPGSENSGAGPEGHGTPSAGRGDGSKEVREAAQLEALGKLSELYQRRALEISGEVVIETDSAQHALKTPYQPTEADHRKSGSTISRDEIPLAYRAFIQRYFQFLRQRNNDHQRSAKE